VVYNGVDLETFSPSPASTGAGSIRLLFVGQDFRRKGLAPLLEALSIAVAAGHTPTLRVIGRDDPKTYRALAETLGVADRVSFEGPSGKIQEAYRNADLFVFPTLYDPFANVCLEALACGLPVLTTSTNGSSEVVGEGAEGYVVEGSANGLPARLAEKIGMFCALPENERAAMRLAARAKAERYTIAANANRVLELLTGRGEG
jgi:UDP-glucose:(heptosyl)LPS alpha-1,3-glucosyltransferase